MALTNFPTALDDDGSLYQVTDLSSALIAAHHNSIKDAVKEIEVMLGIRSSGVPTSIQYRLGNPTGGHTHDFNASGMGGPVYNAVFPQHASAISAFRGGLAIQLPIQPTTPGFATTAMLYFDENMGGLVFSDGFDWWLVGATGPLPI
jgi:hypothetical protein